MENPSELVRRHGNRNSRNRTDLKLSDESASELSETLYSVNQSVAVNRESSRDSAILDGVGIRKRAILDVDLEGRDA